MTGCEAERPIARAESAAGPSGSPDPVVARPAAFELQSQSPRGPVGNPLCLRLDAPRVKVHLGEPITLVASLVNCSSQVQHVQDLLAPEFGFLQVWIRTPQGMEAVNKPVTLREGRGKAARPLAPGERLTAVVPIYFGQDGWTMTQAGEYRIRAEYGVESAPIASNPVTLMVQAPSNAVDRKAADILMTPEAGHFLLSGRDQRGEGSKRMTTLTQEYGESHLAPYASLALAFAASRDRFDPETKTFRTDGCSRAVEQFARAVPRVTDPVLAATGTATWSDCLKRLGRDAEASRAVSMFFESHPEARTLPGVSELVAPPLRKE